MSQPLLTVAGLSFGPLELSVAAGALLFVALAGALIAVLARRGAAVEALAAGRARELEGLLAELVSAQGEMKGCMQTLAEVMSSRQGELSRSLNERLDQVTHRLGQSMSETQRNTHENLQRLHERLAVIDTAQRHITALSSQVVELQSILSNKQTRGTFGQGRMEAIIADHLPRGAYTFQATLSNGRRPDCLVHLPNGTGDLVIDAKFPLEAYNALKAADSPEAQKAAAARFRQDVGKHIADIAERYFITGETQDTAFMFVPSESIFAEINESFEDVVQRAHRARVVIVSPSLLMLSIQVIQAILRDQRMREQAHLIQAEVIRLLEDIGRLNERVTKLQTHFVQASRDVEQILISTDKVTKRGARIEALDLDEDGAARPPLPPRHEADAG